MKKITVVIPCYNDSNSIEEMHRRLTDVFETQLKSYDYDIYFIDDRSPDDTWEKIKSVCAIDSRVKGIRNLRNFGYYRNVFSAMLYGRDSDATFMVVGDLQDPPEKLPEFVKFWEGGYKAVLGARVNTYNSFFVRILRKLYYNLLMKLVDDGRKLNGVNSFGLYDKKVIQILEQVDDIQPFLPGIVSEYVKQIKIIDVVQEKSRRGKSSFSFWSKYDGAITSITLRTKLFLRLVTFIGVIVGIFSILFAIFIVIQTVFTWNLFNTGIPSLLTGVFFLGAVQLFFLGILGEYVFSINNRSIKRPLVIVDEKLNINEALYDK